MKYRVADANKADLPVNRLCDVLGVSVSGYYSWKSRKMSKRQREDMIYLAHIRASFFESNQSYGVRRIHADLQEKSLAIGRERTARLMRDNTLKPRRTKRFKRTTDSNHKHPIAENKLDQNFSCQAPDEKWGVDISYSAPRPTNGEAYVWNAKEKGGCDEFACPSLDFAPYD